MAVAAPRRKSARGKDRTPPSAVRALVYAKFINLNAFADDSRESPQIVFNMARGLIPQKVKTVVACAESLGCKPAVLLDAVADTSRALADAMKAKMKAAS